MLNPLYRYRFAVVFMGLILLLIGAANASVNAKLNKKLEKIMEKVRTGKTLDVRADAAEQLAKLTNGIDPLTVDDKTVADMVLLLDSPDDPVRGWVAGALGHLGPRAKVAVPKLLALLPEAYCQMGSGPTTDGFITLALKRMGVDPPPPLTLDECMSMQKTGAHPSAVSGPALRF